MRTVLIAWFLNSLMIGVLLGVVLLFLPLLKKRYTAAFRCKLWLVLAVLLLLPLHSAGNFLRAPVEWHTPESFRQPLTSLTAFQQPKNSSAEEKAQPEESVSKASEKVENTALTNSGEAAQLPTNSRNKTASSGSAGAGSDASFEQQNPAQPSAEPHESGLTTVASALTKTLKSVTVLEVLALVWIGGMLVLGVRQAWGIFASSAICGEPAIRCKTWRFLRSYRPWLPAFVCERFPH